MAASVEDAVPTASRAERNHSATRRTFQMTWLRRIGRGLPSNIMDYLKFFAPVVVSLTLVPAHTIAADDPACAGKDPNVCDMLGFMINAKGKGCYRMLSVTPLASTTGGDRYRIVCRLNSTSNEQVTYTLEFGPDSQSYEVR